MFRGTDLPLRLGFQDVVVKETSTRSSSSAITLNFSPPMLWLEQRHAIASFGKN